MRVVVTGAGGQLGREVAAVFAARGHDVTAAAHADLDVGDRDAVMGLITSVRPDVVVHTAAWTAVDDCESDTDRAWRVNALGCRHVADASRLVSAHLCALSTDYVFDGESARPYTEWDRTNPINAYGRSKEAGEREVLGLATGASIVRTSWLAGAAGPNFVRTMLRRASESGEVRVVDDQHGCPTFARDLAGAIAGIVAAHLPGVFHVTNQGPTTWWGLARATFALAGADQERVIPISTADLVPPRPARRPANAVLDNAALRLAGLPLLPDHRDALERFVKEVAVVSRVAVIGTGYVGLTTGAYLAHIGHDVVCADVIEDKIACLSRGELPIFEPGLEEMVGGGLASGRLRFVVGSAPAVRGSEFVYLCLPTPQGDDGSADLSFIREEAERIGPLLDPGTVVVNKSTVPVGSTRLVQQVLNRGDVFVVSNPEFLREGSAVHDSLNPDRIVIGADDPAAASRVSALYDRLNAPVLVTDPASAELIKYASNAFLATKISYINAIANLCEAVGADVREVVLGMGYDKRIGFEFLRPGPGWGGSCFPKDTRALVRIAEDAGYDFGLLEGVIEVNAEQYERMVTKIRTAAPGGDVNGRTVAVWGLTFKAMTDDLRDSPSLEVVRRLLARGARVRAYDPLVPRARAAADSRLEGVTVCDDPYDACVGADLVALLTEWDELRWLDFDKVRDLLNHAVLVDCRNLLDPAAMRKRGFSYVGVGRP